MASYNELNALIDAYINRNGVQAITGQILNGVLKAMVEQLGRGYTIMGAATPATDPGTPDGPESWFASTPGTYTNMGGLTVANAELALLSYTPSDGWAKTTLTQGITEVQATIDANVGIPEVSADYVNGVLYFDFKNLKGTQGDPGQTGAAAGFGIPTATVDGNVGTPGVSVSASGPDTAKVFSFAFTNLKGDQGDQGIQGPEGPEGPTGPAGVTSVVATVDNTTGNPACTVSLNAGVLTLAFTGLKGAQGDTGSSVAYPFTIVNNLTTDDATQALSAAMGVQLEGEITQLELKVDDLIADLSETSQTNYSGDANYVIGTGTYNTGNGSVWALSGYSRYRKDFTEDVIVSYNLKDQYATIWKSPQGGTKVLVDSGICSGSITLVSGDGIVWSEKDSTTDNKIEVPAVGPLKDFATKDQIDTEVNPVIDQINFDRGIRQKADRYSSLMSDWMQVVNAGSGMSSVAVLSVVSSTTDTLTLLAADAATFTNDYNPCIVRWSDGTVKLVYFQAASGDTVTLMPFDTTDISGASQVQSIHDTVRGGYGIHLSQLGYIFLGEWMAGELIKKITQKDSNLLASVQFYNATETADKNTIKSVEGIAVASVDSDMLTTGNTPSYMVQEYGFSTAQYNATHCGFLYTCYKFRQAKDHYLTFTLPVCGEGWLEVQAGQIAEKNTSTGVVTMKVYIDGVLSSTQNLTQKNEKYVLEGLKPKSTVAVKFETTTADCECCIYSINFWAMNGFVTAASLNGKKVAFLGDSWTQFPSASLGLPEYSSYNTVVTRPDGTTGSGLGYMPKAFATKSGATVDNWGKLDMRADDWGLVKIDDVLAYTNYDYVVIEFFINDYHDGISASAWAANIARIAEKCKSAGARPIIVCPCRTNGQAIDPFGQMNEMVMRGLGSF